MKVDRLSKTVVQNWTFKQTKNKAVLNPQVMTVGKKLSLLR